MGKKKKKSIRQRDAPTQEQKNIALWIQSDEAKDMICPPGYTPLDKVPAVRQCVHIIADLVSSMTLQLMENTDKGDIRLWNGLSRKLDIEPSQYIPRKNFYYQIASDMVMYGNCVALPVFDQIGLDYIDLIPHSRVSLNPKLDGYVVRIGGVEFDPSEILHFPYIPDPDYPWRGVGVMDDVIDAVNTLCQANKTKQGFMSSKWKPSVIISVPTDSEVLQTKEGRDKVLGSYVADTQAGEPWVIPAGQIDIKTLRPLTLNDLSIQSSIELDLKTIASAIGVPAFLIGLGSFSKDEYNSFISSKVLSVAQVIQQVLTRQLLYKSEWYFEFKSRSLMQYDLTAVTSFIKTGIDGGWMSRNEGRAEVGLPPREGLDEILMLENYIPVDRLGDQKKLNNGGDTDGEE